MGLLASILVTVAHAQLGDPGETTGVDTEFTPVAKQSALWTQIGGARFGAKEAIEDSQTPITTDLFTVDFRHNEDGSPDPDNGFMAGAACGDPDTAFDGLDACERVPVIYRYHLVDGSPEIEEVYRSPDSGYVGAVAWMTNGNALAVGGTRTYPRREHARLPGESDDDYAASDPAGEPRAWLYADHDGLGSEGQSWKELPASALEPPDPGGAKMRALNALDCSLRNKELCVAGGLGQLWHWRDGKFEKRYDAKSKDTATEEDSKIEFSNAKSFRFRVREVRFQPRAAPASAEGIYAVTSGCCAEPSADPERPVEPRILTYSATVNAGAGQWASSSPLLGDPERSLSGTDASRRLLPDSYYSVVVSPAGGLSFVVSPGGPLINPSDPTASLSEPPSRIAPRAGELSYAATLSTARLVAADGDFTRPPPSYSAKLSGGEDIKADTQPDKILDWAVGQLRASGQAAAYTTLDQGALVSPPLGCGVQGFNSCAPGRTDRIQESLDVEKAQDGAASRSLIELPSYALNAFRFSTSDGSVAWAVGDRGAVMRLGGSGAVGADAPQPPRLGARQEDPFPQRAPYKDRHPQASSEVGAVPALIGQPREHPSSPKLVSAGTPDPTRLNSAPKENVTRIVMSRDGSEGWALGSSEVPSESFLRMPLYHYEGSRWTRCDAVGVEDKVTHEQRAEPDRACAELAPLYEPKRFGGTSQPVSVPFAARVPFENDTDPTNDDEFEVVALATSYKPPGASQPFSVTVLRYSKSRWALDEQMSQSLSAVFVNIEHVADLAFTAPNDGWAVGDGAASVMLAHFDGEGWSNCAASWADCGEQGGLLASMQGAVDRATLRLATAGRRLYLTGTRLNQTSSLPSVGSTTSSFDPFPMILAKDLHGRWEQDYDPGCELQPAPGECVASPDSTKQGRLSGVSVTELSDGRLAGWARGTFGPNLTRLATHAGDSVGADSRYLQSGESVLLRLDPERAEWRPWVTDDAGADYLSLDRSAGFPLSVTGPDGAERSFLRPPDSTITPFYPVLAYDTKRERWRTLATPFLSSPHVLDVKTAIVQANIQAFAPDGQGGFWLAVMENAFLGALRRGGTLSGHPHYANFFYHYTDQVPEEVFTDVQHPIREPVVTAAAGDDQSFWVATRSNAVYRYDRLTGWEGARVPGWNVGRTVTAPSEANAIAIGPDGRGVLVGKAGRIADLSPQGVKLDAAAGTVCKTVPPTPPCGTSFDLTAVAVAPDGSAIVAGKRRSLLWRPAGGEFRSVERPPVLSETVFNAVSMPRSDRAWLTTLDGEIFRGDLRGDCQHAPDAESWWCWMLENRDWSDKLVNRDAEDKPIRLNALALDAEGRGLGVGERGWILERTGDGPTPWRRLDARYLDHLWSVALPPRGYGDGDGVLIGGSTGLILTRINGSFEVARQADIYHSLAPAIGPSESTRIVSVALLPGYEPGQLEAWALTRYLPGTRIERAPAPFAILHYTSSPEEPLLNPDGHGRAESAPDLAMPREGGLAFAAFGRQECQLPSPTCPGMNGSNLSHEILAQRVVEAIGASGKAAESTDLALFTGDAANSAGQDDQGNTIPEPNSALDINVMHNRWAEFVANPLKDAGVPLFGAVGGQDVSQTSACDNSRCIGTNQLLPGQGAGTNLAWRNAMKDMPAPWGNGPPAKSGSIQFKPVRDRPLAVRPEDVGVKGPDGSEPVSELAGGARTHYAADIIDTAKDSNRELARLVVVDTSFLRSMTASDPMQNPLEPQGGQATWLEEMLCIKGVTDQASTARCTRKPHQQAIVLTNTPTYSYGPGAIDATMVDGAAFEAILMRHRTNVVITGRLGWNGLYYATAPGIHEPCPGGSYPSEPPKAGTRLCGEGAEASASPDAAAKEVGKALTDAGAPLPSTLQDQLGGANLTGALPFVVASNAGGKFGPRGTDSGPAKDGYWRGYTVVRLDPSGDPRKMVVEQRPVLDWVGIQAQEHVLRPGQRMTLKGYGRQPVGMDQPIHYIDIDGPAVTHRYDLIEADPEKPWLPKVDAGLKAEDPESNGYVSLDPSVASVDDQAGLVKVGRGNNPRTFAIGLLSIGEKSAVWPLVFEPRRTFKATTSEQRPVAQLRTQSGFNPPDAPPPPPPNTTVQPLKLPEPPPPPVLPGLSAPQVQSPQPPIPPPPPIQQHPVPLDLSASAPGITIAPQTTVIPPPAPPIQPAPPGGARREARQRQSATQSSGSGTSPEEASGEGMDPGSSLGRVNLVDSPNQPATRRDTRRDTRVDRYEFTAVARSNDLPVGRVVLYGGGITLFALALALGTTGGHPRPRGRGSIEPAPGWSWSNPRRRP